MKQTLPARLCALAMALCLCVPLAPASAETFLPDGEVTHTDFTLQLTLHADGFPAGKAHLKAWETFLSKLDLKGSADTLALFTPLSRAYLNASLRLNGKDTLPFVYDQYYSFRYLISPALNNEPLFFQMYNFQEFMLKPYYYMELPTQYLALLMYPDAAYWLGDSYYTPVAELLADARETALDDAGTAQEAATAAQGSAGTTQEAADATLEAADAAQEAADATQDGAGTTQEAADATQEAADITLEAADITLEVADAAPDGTLTYTVPYEDLYELCETLDLIVNDDPELERAYFFITCLLTETYSSDMVLDMLGNLENELDNLDPDQNGMTVTETADGMTCTLGDTDLFVKTVEDGATAFTLTLPTSEDYVLIFDCRWDPSGDGAALSAQLSITLNGEQALLLTADGEGLPRAGDLGGAGNLTFTASGYTFTQEMPPVIFDFNWSRDAAQKPYTLSLNVDWIHPDTLKPALSLAFNGNLSTVDKSVFKDGVYPQNDFFSLNETYLDEYKQRLLPTLLLKLVPIVLETPGGVIDDIYRFATDTDILVSFVE
jgi:hypothetical protein